MYQWICPNSDRLHRAMSWPKLWPKWWQIGSRPDGPPYRQESKEFHSRRQAADNIVLAQVIMHSFRYKKGNKGWLAIKTDLQKVYNRISWSFLEEVLRKVGMVEYLIRLIMFCVSSTQISMIWMARFWNHFNLVEGCGMEIHFPLTCLFCVWRLWGKGLRKMCKQRDGKGKSWLEVVVVSPICFLLMI